MKQSPILLMMVLRLIFSSAPTACARFQENHVQIQYGSQTPCWQNAYTQLAMNKCADADLRQSDADLNRTYQQVLSKYSNDPIRIAQIKKAETAWLAFRDAEIDALFPESSRLERGTVYPMCRAMHLTGITVERTKALKALLEHEEGDVCAP